MKPQERRLGVAEIEGWYIESITTTRFEATKDGVRLDSNSFVGIVEQIQKRKEEENDDA